MSNSEILKRKIQRERAARKEAERLLEAKSRELYVANKKTAQIALFPQLSPYPILRFDNKGMLVLANPAAARTILNVAEESEEISLIELFPFTRALDINKLICENQVAVFTHQIHDSHYQFVFNGVSEFNFLNLYLSDITAIERAKKEIEKLHGETERLLSSISSVLIGINEKGEINRINSVALDLFRLKEHEIIGQHIDLAKIDWALGPLKEIVEQLSDQEELSFEDVIYTKADGRTGYLGIVVNKVSGSVDAPEGYLILARDVTLRKELEIQLLQAQKLESLGQLAAGIAHEINTPIQFISDNTRFLDVAIKRFDAALKKSEDLLERYKSGHFIDAMVMEIEEAITSAKIGYMRKEIPFAIEETIGGLDQVASIVSGMKQFSHPGTGNKQLIDINASIQNALSISKNEWKYVADIACNLDESLPQIHCYSTELNQVLLNVIVNAAHAIKDAQDTQAKSKGTITIGSSVVEDHVEIAISDTGTGIPVEAQPKIFDPFFTTKEVGKGTGQGLSIAYNVVVKRHGGSISFETELGIGTVFRILLPL